MLINEVINTKQQILQLPKHVRALCSQFLADSAGLPLFRELPTSHDTITKVKVRTKKSPSSLVGEVMNRAFEHQYAKLSQRSIFAHPVPRVTNESNEPFYVFPINGYKFMYSKEVQNSSNEYSQLIDTLFDTLDDGAIVGELATDVLKSTYATNELYEGIVSQAEIVIYGIPYYYAVKASECPDYARLVA